jgi:hypothetical protein
METPASFTIAFFLLSSMLSFMKSCAYSTLQYLLYYGYSACCYTIIQFHIPWSDSSYSDSLFATDNSLEALSASPDITKCAINGSSSTTSDSYSDIPEAPLILPQPARGGIRRRLNHLGGLFHSLRSIRSRGMSKISRRMSRLRRLSGGLRYVGCSETRKGKMRFGTFFVLLFSVENKRIQFLISNQFLLFAQNSTIL